MELIAALWWVGPALVIACVLVAFVVAGLAESHVECHRCGRLDLWPLNLACLDGQSRPVCRPCASSLIRGGRVHRIER